MPTIIVEHTGRPCRYCGEPMRPPTREHMRPRSRLAVPLGAVNRILACEPCNVEKGARTLLEFLADLIAAGDTRAQRVAGVIQGLCARGLYEICHDGGPEP